MVKKIVGLNIIILSININALTQCFQRSVIPDDIKLKVNWFNNLFFSGGNLSGKQFSNAYFDTAANLENLASTVTFESSRFNGKTFFNKLDFNADVIFDNAQFNGRTEFSELTINGSLSFEKTTFLGRVLFHDLDFENDKASFSLNATRLPDTIFFDYNDKIPQVDFTEANFFNENKNHFITLFRSDISKIKIDYDHFKLLWYNCVGSPVPSSERISVYEQLLKNFKDRGQLHDFQMLDEEYIDYKWRQKHLHFVGYISKLWWDYGYNKELVFMWTAIFISLFTFITFPKLNHLNQNVYSISKIPKLPTLINRDKFNGIKNDFVLQRFYMRYNKNLAPCTLSNVFTKFWYSFLYSSSIFFRLSLSTDKIDFTKKWSIYLIIVYTVGIICLAYMANYILQK